MCPIFCVFTLLSNEATAESLIYDILGNSSLPFFGHVPVVWLLNGEAVPWHLVHISFQHLSHSVMVFVTNGLSS